MKLLMSTGALAGFMTGLAVGWFQHVPWPTLLWRAALAAYITCILAGWWGRHWSRNLKLAQQAQPVATSTAHPTTLPRRP